MKIFFKEESRTTIILAIFELRKEKMALLNLMGFKQKQEMQQPHQNQHLLIIKKPPL